jgi:hypothetical protein
MWRAILVGNHKWSIKRYKEPELIVSQTVGEASLAAWKAGVPLISLPDNINVSTASISAIEETNRPDDVYLAITSGLEEKTSVLLNDKNEVLTNWYKINVGSQGYEKTYAAYPWYFKLVSSDNSIWVAVRLPEHSGIYERGQDVVKCDEAEVKMLDRISHA